MTPSKKPPHISQEDWDSVDSPPIPTNMIKRMRPASENQPELVEAMRKRGERGPQKAPIKKSVTIRLDADVIEYFKKDGKGWQSRLNDTLKKVVGS